MIMEGRNMEHEPDVEKIGKEMKPGTISRDGFLGTDKRSLSEILKEDEEAISRLRVTHKGIAEKMRNLRNAGMKGLGDFINIPPHFEALVDSFRGKLPCPFGHPGVIPKINTTVRNLKTEKEITYTDMNIHLIAAHGFYEGKGAPFRLEPEVLVAILEIKPES